jgi:hypothetical protein
MSKDVQVRSLSAVLQTNKTRKVNMKKLIMIPVAALLIMMGACAGSNNFRDVNGVKSHDPDLIENYNNMDGHPNVGVLCIHGVAFYSTTRDYNSFGRVPEWDRICPGYTANK